MKDKRDFNEELKEIFEAISSQGAELGLSVYVGDALKNANLKSKQKALRDTADYCTRLVNEYEKSLRNAETLFNNNIYYVFEAEGVKQVVIEGYYYEEDGIKYNGFNGFYNSIPISRERPLLIEHSIETFVGVIDENTLVEQYDKVLKYYPHLPIENVTQDTPCGLYIDM